MARKYYIKNSATGQYAVQPTSKGAVVCHTPVAGINCFAPERSGQLDFYWGTEANCLKFIARNKLVDAVLAEDGSFGGAAFAGRSDRTAKDLWRGTEEYLRELVSKYCADGMNGYLDTVEKFRKAIDADKGDGIATFWATHNYAEELTERYHVYGRFADVKAAMDNGHEGRTLTAVELLAELFATGRRAKGDLLRNCGAARSTSAWANAEIQCEANARVKTVEAIERLFWDLKYIEHDLNQAFDWIYKGTHYSSVISERLDPVQDAWEAAHPGTKFNPETIRATMETLKALVAKNAP